MDKWIQMWAIQRPPRCSQLFLSKVERKRRLHVYNTSADPELATVIWIAPRHDSSISQDGSKCTSCRLNLLHPELPMDCRAVTPIVWVAPCNDRSIRQDGSKCMTCRLKLLHIHELILDFRAVTTAVWISPHDHGAVFQDAANAPTPSSRSRAGSPPTNPVPQTIRTGPSLSWTADQ